MSFYIARIKLSPDLERILKVPRRSWTDEQGTALAEEMTQLLKVPKGTMSLRPVQAIALYEIGTYGGMFGPIRVGGGKTLISLLAPYVLESQRPVLILPAGLIPKTTREMGTLLAHWRIPRNIRLISYESLGRVNAATLLEAYQPDLLILDEAHRIKNPKAAVTRRIVRYMEANPETKVVAMSGTLIKHSIKDFAHLMRWALKENSVVPFDKGEMFQWAEVLDDAAIHRVDPGELLRLATPEDRAQGLFRGARLGFNRRLLETPGVVEAQGPGATCSLAIDAVTYQPNRTTEENFEVLREAWVTPDDWELMQAVEVWACARQLALGFHYIWDPRPPMAWMNARKDWGKFVREILSKSRTLDSEHQVALACEAGELDDQYYKRWKAIQPTFKAFTKPVWHDTGALEFCEAWLKKKHGICWVEHSFFGRELSRRTGIPYFGRDGVDSNGVLIDLPKADHEGKPIIASQRANATGRNLQKWDHNLITSLPSGADEMEQLIGRTHREGQESDEVTVDIMFSCAEHVDAWEKALSGAQMTQDLMGQSQKVLQCDNLVDLRTLHSYTGTRWKKSLSEKDPGFVLPLSKKEK